MMLQLALHFSQIGYRCVLVTSFRDEEGEYPVPQGITRLSLEEKEIHRSLIGRNIIRIVKLRKICKELRPVALISFLPEPNFRALCATVGLPVKNIISVRNDPDREYEGLAKHILGKLVYLLADGCVFQTADAKKWFPKPLQQKSAIILNDVKETFFSIDRKPSKTVVSIGRLSPQKNYCLLIDAYAKIAAKYPEHRLWIVGAGKLKDTLQQQIRAWKLEESVLLYGATSDVAAVLRQAEAFVLSSDYEGLPNCLMEAMAAGVPCIATDCPSGGPKALIHNMDNGILVPVNERDQLADALDRLLSDELLREKLSANAKKSAEAFRPHIVFAQWRDYVESILNTGTMA